VPEVRAGRSISALLDRRDPWATLEAPSPGEARRAARYGALVSQLAAGRLSSADFRRRVESWRPLRSERFLADPDRVLAELEVRRAADVELFHYSSGRRP
jgi:hypothetical protein